MEYQPKYNKLNDYPPGIVAPPPQRRNVPKYQTKKRSSCCCRCACLCFCFWISFIIALALLGFGLYTYLSPQAPEYNVNRFGVNSFKLDPDYTLHSEFAVDVKAVNPNKRIGFDYGKDSSIVVIYSGTTLCSGKLPTFHQPHSNTTVIKIILKGQSEFGSGLQEALMDNKKKKKIPLLVMVRAPVSLIIDGHAMRQVVVYVNCSLVVSNMSPNQKAEILSKSYDYKLMFS